MTKIRPSQIGQGGASTDDALVWDGSDWAPTDLNATYLAPVIPVAHGVNGDGTDESAAIQAMLTASAGKCVWWDAGKTYRADSALVHPGGYVAFRSLGGAPDSVNPAAAAGARLDLRFAGYRLQCLKVGTLDVEGVQFTNGGAAAGTFILCTLTQPRIRGNTFLGRSTVTGATCDEDAVQLGGTDTTIDADSLTSGFGGYGGWVENNSHSRIRRGAYLRNFADSVNVRGLYADGFCGAPDVGTGSAAFVEIDPTATGGHFALGNIVEGCLIEIGHYRYGVAVRGQSGNNVVGPNGYWDAGAVTVADVRIDATARNNTVDVSGAGSGRLQVEDATNGLSIIRAVRPRSATLTANVSSTTTAAYTDVFTTGAATAQGPAMHVQMLGFSSLDSAGGYMQFKLTCVETAQSFLVGSIQTANLGPHSHATAAVFTGLTPGTAYTFKVSVQVSAGTWRCRAVAFPDSEWMALKIEEVVPV